MSKFGLALEATEPVSQLATQMAVEMININFISVKQKLNSCSCNNHNKQTLKWCCLDGEILLKQLLANYAETRASILELNW